jgi:hypothetical protein
MPARYVSFRNLQTSPENLRFLDIRISGQRSTFLELVYCLQCRLLIKIHISQFFMSFEKNGFMRHLNHGINAISPPAACRLPLRNATRPRILPSVRLKTTGEKASACRNLDILRQHRISDMLGICAISINENRSRKTKPTD